MEASAVPRVAPAGVAALASPGLLRLLTDDRLVALIRDGNRNAFEAVYDRHYRAILSFCRHMLGCADEAEDAVQHTFIAAYNDLMSSRKPIRLRAWLFTIARNRCLSILRARRERTALEFEERATDGLAVQVQRRQDLRDLVVDINHLPEDQRAALVLAEMGALSHDEIGSVLGVPKGKVKALIFQARESLLADRAAREADCQEIREQLSTMRGAALRRTTLRRHLRGCQACREYRHELERQRRRLAVILPVAPTIALREAIVGVTAGGSIAGAGVAGGGLLGASSLIKGVAGKALIAAIVAAAGTTGTILVVHDFRLRRLAHALPALRPPATSFLGASAPRLVPSFDADSAAPAPTASATVVALVGGSGLVTAVNGHQTTTTKAIVHALTGELTSLLTSARPHRELVWAGGAAPPAVTPAPTSPLPGVSVPVTLAPSPPSTPSLPGSRSGPGSGLPAAGSGAPVPSGLCVTSGAPGSTGGSGTPTGSSSGGPSGTGSGSSGSGSGGSGAPGSSSGSGSGSTNGPEPAPGQPPDPASPVASDPASPAGSGSGSGSGSPAGAGSGAGSDPGSAASPGSASGSPAGPGSAGASASGAPGAAGSTGASAPLPASGASTSTPAAPGAAAASAISG